MKKDYKKIFLVIICIIGVFCSIVEAKTCTEIYAAPYIFEVFPDKKSDIYYLNTSENTCMGYNTEVWFSSFKSLPERWAEYGTGYLYVSLYEEDPDGNPDERVKDYVGYVTNRVITSMELNKIVTPGAIDSEGDQQCELYLTFGSSGYQGRAINTSLFNYQICMK